MERIDIHDLAQNASEWLPRVRQGESFEITDGGEAVAKLVPAAQRSIRDQLIAEGVLAPAKGRLEDLGPPLAAIRGRPTLSEILAEMREDER